MVLIFLSTGINVTVPEENIVITSGMLSSFDIDTESFDVRYDVVNMPEHGTLVVEQLHGRIIDDSVTSFTQEDINAGRVQ